MTARKRIPREIIAAVRQISCHQAATALGLSPARESCKFACPCCSSSDALHCYPEAERGAHCFSCDANFRDSIALVMGVADLRFPQAVTWLAEQFEIPTDDLQVDGAEFAQAQDATSSTASSSVPAGRATTGNIDSRPRRSALRPPRDDFTAYQQYVADEARITTWQLWIEMVTSGRPEMKNVPAAEQYLRGRGIQPPLRDGLLDAVVCFVGGDDWAPIVLAVDEHLDTPDPLVGAGVVVRGDDGRYQLLPRSGPFVAFLYYGADGYVDVIRFKLLSGGKTLNPKGRSPSVPFLAFGPDGPQTLRPHAAKHLAPGVVFVAEGETDALSVEGLGYKALGMPGAQTWRAEWCELWRGKKRVVVLCDGDEDAGVDQPEGVDHDDNYFPGEPDTAEEDWSDAEHDRHVEDDRDNGDDVWLNRMILAIGTDESKALGSLCEDLQLHDPSVSAPRIITRAQRENPDLFKHGNEPLTIALTQKGLACHANILKV